MKTSLAFALTVAVTIAVMGCLLSACSFDPAGLAPSSDDAAGQTLERITPPSAHPDAAPAPAPDSEAGAASEAGATTPDGPPDSAPPRSLRQCVSGLDPVVCEGCLDQATDLSALCRAAIACLQTDPPYEFTPVAGGMPDPLGYCASAQPVRACIVHALMLAGC